MVKYYVGSSNVYNLHKNTNNMYLYKESRVYIMSIVYSPLHKFAIHSVV